MSQQIINVGSAPNDGTGDLLRNSQIKSNANFTELYTNKQDNLTDASFGTFANGLTTEDSIVDADLINYTDVSDTNKQKKTTWSNLKAKLKTYFDTLYQVILVSGTNIKTINGTSVLGSGDLVISGGGGTSFKGNWNAETNTPTLINGTGTLGDEYKVSVSGYALSDIYLPNDFIIYDGANWVKSRNNNTDIATRYPLNYNNVNSGTGAQNFGEGGMAENSGAISAAGVVDDYLIFSSIVQNTRRFRTQAVANALTTYISNSWNRISENMGYYYKQVVANADVSTNSTTRFFYGLSASFTVGNTDPSATSGYAIGLAADSADTNVQIFVKSSNAPNTGVTKVNTGWAKSALDTISLTQFRENNSSKVFYIARNATNDQEIKGMFNINPSGVGFTQANRKGSGTNAIASGFHHLSINLRTEI